MNKFIPGEILSVRFNMSIAVFTFDEIISYFVVRSAISFKYNLSPSESPGSIPAEKRSSTYFVMFLDLLRVLEEIDVFDNYNVGAEIETLDVDLKFRQVSKRKNLFLECIFIVT